MKTVLLSALLLAGCQTTMSGDDNRMYNQWCLISFHQCGIDHASAGRRDKQFKLGAADDHEGALSSAIPYHSPLNWENN